MNLSLKIDSKNDTEECQGKNEMTFDYIFFSNVSILKSIYMYFACPIIFDNEYAQ